MTPAERQALARALGVAVVRVNRTVAETGQAVRATVRTGLAPLGPAGSLPMDAVDAQHALVHRLIDHGTTAVAAATGAALAHKADPAAPSLHDREDTTAAWAAARAAFGDTLPEPLNPGVRLIGDLDQAAARPLVVFLHGLGGHDRQWPSSFREPFVDAGFDVIAARYATGRSVAENGRDLALALEKHGQGRPRICLVGHSMGGLVAAAALAAPESEPWRATVTDVVTLGTPFTGAALERVARRALTAGARARTAAPILALGDHRSAGIKELGDGMPAQFPGHVRHVAVIAVLGDSDDALVSRLAGDGMVSAASARGSNPARVVVMPRCHHLGLLSDPRVARLLAEVAATPMRPGTAGRAGR